MKAHRAPTTFPTGGSCIARTKVALSLQRKHPTARAESQLQTRNLAWSTIRRALFIFGTCRVLAASPSQTSCGMLISSARSILCNFLILCIYRYEKINRKKSVAHTEDRCVAFRAVRTSVRMLFVQLWHAWQFIDNFAIEIFKYIRHAESRKCDKWRLVVDNCLNVDSRMSSRACT